MATQLNIDTSIVDLLKSRGQASDFGSRTNVAKTYGINNYTGSAEQNVALINLLKGGTTPTNQMASSPSMGATAPKTPAVSPQGSIQTPTTGPTGVTTPTSPNSYLTDVLSRKAPDTSIDQNVLTEYKGKITNELQTAYQPQLNAISAEETTALSSYAKDKERRLQQFQNNLAMRGTLGVSTQADELLAQHDADERQIEQSIRDTYSAKRANILGLISNGALQAVQEKEKNLIASKQAELEAFNKSREFALDIYKTTSDAELKTKQLALDEKYKSGQLTIDQYNAESQRIQAEARSAEAGANVAKTKAETEKIKSESGGGSYKFTNEDKAMLIGTGFGLTDINNIQNDLGKYGGEQVLGDTKLSPSQKTALNSILSKSKTNQFLSKDYFTSIYTPDQLKSSAKEAGYGGWFSTDTTGYVDHLMSIVDQYRNSGYSDQEILQMMQK